MGGARGRSCACGNEVGGLEGAAAHASMRWAGSRAEHPSKRWAGWKDSYACANKVGGARAVAWGYFL